jgi:hypothetical protein
MNETDINDILKKIKREQGLLAGAMKRGLEHALKIGQYLVEAKGLVGHGNWQDWCEQHVQWSESTCRRYMRLATNWDTLAVNTTDLMHLTIPEALRMLKKPQVDTTTTVPEELMTQAEPTPAPVPEQPHPLAETQMALPVPEEPTTQIETPTAHTLPIRPVAHSGFEQHLAARMSAHGIEGTVLALLALLADLGVDVGKLQAA